PCSSARMDASRSFARRRCRSSTRIPSARRGWRAPPRRATSKPPSHGRSNGSPPATSTRSCSRARCGCTLPRLSSQARSTTRLAAAGVWVAAAGEPVLVKVLNVQHLATPIRAQLREGRSCVELVELLHPTPAVGGEPRTAALDLIPALEGLDRGWYAGPVGWMD